VTTIYIFNKITPKAVFSREDKHLRVTGSLESQPYLMVHMICFFGKQKPGYLASGDPRKKPLYSS
jgi:hypothetical protein